MFILYLSALLIVFFGVINLFRITAFMIGSDIYSLKRHLNRRKKLTYFPFVSIIIPAYNEEKSITSALISILESNYPKDKLQVIVVNDGSKDNTEIVLKEYLSLRNIDSVLIINQDNRGKSHALNNGIKNYSKGELLMCLDADSCLSPYAIRNAISYFEDKKVMALASNVRIAKGKGILNFIQRFEYIICYQMKRAQTVFNVEYIIGGIGSMLRRECLEEVGFYDVDTVTEDIDLTMKILRSGNKNVKVIYGADVVTYTQSVLSIKDLIKQRYRWKWGRFQTFFKNKSMFFTRDKSFTKGLTWFYLPFALYSELAFLFEPLIVGYIIYLIAFYGDFLTLISAIIVISFYMTMNILSEETLTLKDKLKMLPFVPLMYFLFYVLSFVEYFALIKALINMPRLKESLELNKTSWEPVKKIGFVQTQ